MPENLDIDFSRSDWPQQFTEQMKKRLDDLKKEPFVTEDRVVAAWARISTSGTDGVHPNLIKAIMEDERFIKYRKMLELEGVI